MILLARFRLLTLDRHSAARRLDLYGPLVGLHPSAVIEVHEHITRNLDVDGAAEVAAGATPPYQAAARRGWCLP
jgi:hypothetical protein